MTAKLCDFREIVGRFRDAVLSSSALKPRDKVVALVMLGRVNREMWRGLGDLLTWASVETVAQDSALSTRDVERARAALLASGVIERDRPGGRGQAARMRFRLDWLEREEALDAGSGDSFADTGVADRGVGESPDLATDPSALGDKTRDYCPTPVSPKPCDITREPTRALARERVSAGQPDETERDLHGLIAQRIGGHRHGQWFRDCRVSVTGNQLLLIAAPSRFVADQIRQRFSDDLAKLPRIRNVEVRVETRLSGQASLWSHPETRA